MKVRKNNNAPGYLKGRNFGGWAKKFFLIGNFNMALGQKGLIWRPA